MFAIAASARRRGAGFTMIEMMVVVAIVGLMMAIGIPTMSGWVTANKAAGASQFYLEGFQMARMQAIRHNTVSRFLLTSNATNGQLDWQVDICFPSATAPCEEGSDNWSTTTANASGDPEGAAGFKSVARSAADLPPASVIAPLVSPAGASYVYYTPLGWVDTNYPLRITRLEFDPLPAYASQIPSSAVAITLGGMPSRCDPSRAVTDSRGCPP